MSFNDHPLRTTMYSGAAVGAGIVVLFLFADMPIDQWTHTIKGTEIYHSGKWLSLWANGTLWKGISALCLITGCLGRAWDMPEKWSGRLLLVGISVAAAMVVGGYIKYFFGRFRPMELINHGLYGFTFFSTEYMQNSFPSGHTYRIFSAMTALGIAFPKGRFMFLIPAVFIGLSRVVVCKHYPSDVLFGAFIGIMCALWTGYMMDFSRSGK